MPLEPGSSIGPYFVEREIGRGGMGVVYLAKDPRLQRDVAIKALPDHLAEDPARLERFQSEAKTLAQLNHPAVAGIHGLEEKDGKRYLILEYVEGETLSERLERGTPSVDEAIELGIRIASGVEAAHEAGVIHRDLKPDNIRITPAGEVKILDFGLAKMDEGATSSSGMSATVATPVRHSPTIPGTVMGTAAYMSPEQARGRGVDKRTDVWSFGVVLFELLTGSSPFAGESASDSIGAVLHKDVDLDRLPAETPAAVRRVLLRCLARDKAQRYRDIGDVRLELEARDTDGPAPVGIGRGSRIPLVAAAMVALVAIAGWILTAQRVVPTPPADSLHLSIQLPRDMEIHRSIDISPDGRTVVFTARRDGEQQIYLRSLDSSELRVVEGSRDGTEPAFSPDGKSIVFHARNSMYRASVDGGPAFRLGEANWMTADWLDDGTIVFSEGLNSPLFRIPEGRGERTPVTELAADGAYAHVWPQQIPGTSKLLLTSWTSAPGGGARIFDFDTGELRSLVAPETGQAFIPPLRWSASGHLIVEAFDNGLLVLPFDPERDTTISTGDARPLLDNVFHMGNTTRSVFALSDEGTMVYAPGRVGGQRLVWVDAQGGVEPIIDQDQIEGALLGHNVALSPDGEVVVSGGGSDIVEVDLERSIPRRLTVGEGNDLRPVWDTAGDRVLFSSNRDTRWSIWAVRRSGGSEPELVLQRDENVNAIAASPRGDILFSTTSDGTGSDLMILATDGEVRPLAMTKADEVLGSFSADGNWVAYDSDLSGRAEVYLARADGSGMPVQVSTGGGEAPKFGRSGSTLYFRRHRKVMRVEFREGRPVGEIVEVFAARNLQGGAAYDIDADETRMIAVQVDDEAIPRELRVITNFFNVIGGE